MSVVGGARPARTGRYFEGRCETALMAAGYYTMRSPGSHGPVDVLGLKLDRPASPPLLCQVKRTGSAIRPAGWNALYALAARLGGIPLLVDCPTRGRLRFRRLLWLRAEGDQTRLPLEDFTLTTEPNDGGTTP